ncbi:hypothetical protein FNV43_RR26113 [Rhamnella rubrinervis]|uniref:glutathione transferase n=1 Tax=Rhamnella rubrinervis TaxID=2594499 RepID=A0A8K0GJB9_9ROSA|nr:hypothetical protein FNV43_RR26113 [Rhamnella rubrinervis]
MAERNEVKLLGAWGSPFVTRTEIALKLKNVNYAFLQENLAAKSELLLKSNPAQKKVPVLIHGDKPICESLIIVEYIDDVWSSGPSILPSDPYDRATARFWAAYLDDKWLPTTRAIDTVVLAGEGEEARQAQMDKVYEILVLMEEAFKKCSKGKPFFGGDQIGYLDIAFGSFLGWLRFREKVHEIKLIHPAKTPELVKWADRFSQHPAVISVMPTTEQLITNLEYGKNLFAKVRAAYGSK